MEIKGILQKKLSDREGVSQQSGQPWRFAEFLFEVPGQYPKHMVFRVRNGQHDLVPRFESLIGKEVTVSYDLDAHEYNGRWFNQIDAWGILEAVQQQAAPANGTNYQPGTEPLPFEK